MKYLFLVFATLIVTNFSAQTRVSRVSQVGYAKQAPKKKKEKIDINRLNLETKIVGKTALPMLYRFKNKQLILNGAGLRELLWVDVYACGLYLRRPESNPIHILDKDEIMIVRMDILSKAVSQKKLIKAFEKGFEDGNSEAVIKRFKPELAEFISFLNVTLEVGDKVDLVYEPKLGVSLYINYEKKGTVGNLAFKKAIFNIWLSNKPVDKSLKPELLDGKEVLKFIKK